MKEKEPTRFRKRKAFMVYEDVDGITRIERDYHVVSKRDEQGNVYTNPLLDITIFQERKSNEKQKDT